MFPVPGGPDVIYPYPFPANWPYPGATTDSLSLSDNEQQYSTCDNAVAGSLDVGGSLNVTFQYGIFNGFRCTFDHEELDHYGTVLQGHTRWNGDGCQWNLGPVMPSIPVYATWNGTYTPVITDSSGRFTTAVLAGTLAIAVDPPVSP